MSPPALDPGAAVERTALAWGRTTLALVVLAAVLLRLEATGPAGLTAAAVVLAAAVLQVRSRRRYRALRAAVAQGRPMGVGRLPAVATLIVVLLSLAIAVTVL